MESAGAGYENDQLIISFHSNAGHNAYRTEVAMLTANGTWYVVAPESNSTDCAASATGPSLANKQAN